jgi:hypothetical protein
MLNGSVKPVLLFSTVLVLASCAESLLSDERIKSNTAGVLGVPVNQLTISDRRTEVTNTYYIATTSSGARFACTINGGTVLAAGMVNTPTCNRAAQ